jgi:hypothetical protein
MLEYMFKAFIDKKFFAATKNKAVVAYGSFFFLLDKSLVQTLHEDRHQCGARSYYIETNYSKSINNNNFYSFFQEKEWNTYKPISVHLNSTELCILHNYETIQLSTSNNDFKILNLINQSAQRYKKFIESTFLDTKTNTLFFVKNIETFKMESEKYCQSIFLKINVFDITNNKDTILLENDNYFSPFNESLKKV